MRRTCALFALLSLWAANGLAQGTGPVVEVVRVFPNKVRYSPNDAGSVKVTLRNTAATDQAVAVEGEIVQELTRLVPLPSRKVTVRAKGETEVDLPFTAPAHEYGCAVRVRVVQKGAVLARAQDMFAVADNVWHVAIGATLTIMDMSGRPWQDPPNDIKIARERYFNWWEKMFWPPDDWGNMTPETESWYSGQGGRYEVKKVLKQSTVLARANGIASITYGKSTAGGPAGWELARQHPDWFNQDALGCVIGTYNTDIFARWESLPRFDGRPWYYLYPNLTRMDALDHGIDEILNSATEYGWDGVRFDGDFTWVASDAVGARNQRRMKERIWAKLPGFVFGYNCAYRPPDSDPATWPHGLRESLAGGGHWMNEGIGNNDYGYASNGRYTSYREYWERESEAADRLRKIGASYHFIYYLPKETRGLYKFILGTSAGTHPVYGESAAAPGCANWGRFLTRWSAFVWDVNLRNCPAGDAQVTSPVPLWHSVKDRVADAGTKTTVIHLIVPPTIDDPKDPKVQVGPPAANVVVRARIPADETVVRAAAIAPEQPDDALTLAVTREGEWAVATVPEVKTWTLVVFERRGKYDLPAYPRFTEPPDPEEVQSGVEAGAGKLMRDPLRPDASSETTPKVRVLEMESLYQTQAKVEPDKDASGGSCTRIDHTMANSSVIDHAIYPNVTPGRYRATYRLKLKSKTDDAGKPVGAGFGLYVMLGEKQLWLREIGPNDFKTPGRYEDFPVEFDFLGEGRTINTSAFWRGQQAGGTVYADKITLEQLSTFTDADLAAKLKYAPHKGAAPGGAPGLHVLIVNGLYNDLYRLPKSLELVGKVVDLGAPPPGAAPKPPGDVKNEPKPLAKPTAGVGVSYATVDVGEGSATLTGFPKDPAELWKCDVVALVNVDASWLQFHGRAWLRDFVEAGGGLLVLGGNFTLGQGNFTGTYLAEMLPIEVARGRDVVPAEKPLRLEPLRDPLRPPTGLARDLPAEALKTPALLYWRHVVKAKPGAQIDLMAGGEPVLFTGTFGKGHVAVFTGTVLGAPSAHEQPFWQSPAWPLLMKNAMQWLRPRPTNKW